MKHVTFPAFLLSLLAAGPGAIAGPATAEPAAAEPAAARPASAESAAARPVSAKPAGARAVAAKSASAGPSFQWLALDGGARPLQAYVARPGEGGRGAVVLIHEIFGLSDWITRVADRLAAAGYVAIAPDLLSGLGPDGGGTAAFASRDEVTRAVSGLPAEQVRADLRLATAYARSLPQAAGVVSVAGFCWGGSQAFDQATLQPDLAAAFVFYGTGPADGDATARIQAPVYGFYGGSDGRVTGTVAATAEGMAAAGRRYEPVTYEGAGHGFLRSGEESGASAANRAAAEQAWARWLGLLADLAPTAVEPATWGQVKDR